MLGQFRLNIFYYPIISKHFVRPVSSKHFVRPISSKHFLYNNYLFVQFSCLNLFRPVSFYIITISFIQIIITIFFLFFLIFFSFPLPPNPWTTTRFAGCSPFPTHPPAHPQPTPNPTHMVMVIAHFVGYNHIYKYGLRPVALRATGLAQTRVNNAFILYYWIKTLKH